MISNIRIISADDVRRACSMPQAIEAMKIAFSKLSSGEANVPLRTSLQVTEQTEALVMPVSMKGSSTFGLKAVSLTADNAARGLPRIQGIVLLFDSNTGEPRCLIDGEFLTALRTGAASGLATDLLANPKAKHLAVFGTGKQAASQVEAVLAVRPIETVTVVSRYPQRAGKFCNELQNYGDFQLNCTSDCAKVTNADVICTATPSREPLFAGNHLPEQCHINAIGSYRRDMCEIDIELLSTMTIVVDQREACLVEAGEIVLAMRRGVIQECDVNELGDLLLEGKAIDLKSRTLFKSVGNAVQDLAVADFVFHQACEQGLGKLIEM